MEPEFKNCPCADCGIETLVTDSDDRSEFYMVKNSMWEAMGAGTGYLCIDCLEGRLGRTLRAEDFSDVPLNNLDTVDNPRWAWSYRTTRLTHRLGNTVIEEVSNA